MNNFTLGGALILNSPCLLQTLWKHITSEDKFMILSRTTGAIIWNENQDKNVIVCAFGTKGSWRKFPLQPGSRGAPKVWARFMEPLQPCQLQPSAAWCLGTVSRNREEFQHRCPYDCLHLKSLTITLQKFPETSDQVDADVARLVPEVACSPGYLGL